jgi:hypothetical protein
VGVFLVVIANWVLMAMFGIGFIIFAITMFFGGALLAGLAGAAFGGPGDGGAGMGAAAGLGVLMIVFAVLLGAMYLANVVLNMVGMGLCMQAPPSIRPMAIAAFACAAIALVISLLNQFVIHHQAAGSVSGLLNLASFICWVLFLRSAASELGDADLAGKFIMYMVTWFLFVVVAVIAIIVVVCAGAGAMAGAAGGQDPGNAAVAGGVMFVVLGLVYIAILLTFLGLTVWYCLLLQRLRGAIAGHLERG